MILIFGGAYQGKLDYALERYGLDGGDVFRCGEDSVDMAIDKKIIYGLEKWILALVKRGADTDNAISRFIEENESAIVICDDISCGVVPADPVLRKWREATGRALAKVAGASNEVVRVYYGIPSRIDSGGAS